ncbi:MAG TPA: hypothetical protein VFS43_22145 [Polyangiaceae bacterium]|nr:hypothetical protein [Polyangiaceae bacterium]
MKHRFNSMLVLGALAASLAAVGCQKSARQQQEEAAAAQRELDETRREVQKDLAEARREAQKEVAEAERHARETAAEARNAPAVGGANAVLAPNRGDYLRRHRDELITLDQKVDALEARAATATGKAKAELNAKVKRLREQRAALGRQLDTVGTVADATWSSFAANLDKSFDDFEAAVDRASE